MALIKCPKCGKEVSDKAEKCPQCAWNLNLNRESNDLPIKETAKRNNLKNNKIFIAIILILLIIVGLLIILLMKDRNVSSEESAPKLSTETSSDHLESVQNDIKKDTFSVNKPVYENEQFSLVCNTIDKNGITFTATSKLENRNCSIIISNIALDGVCVQNIEVPFIDLEPNSSKEVFFKCELLETEHKFLSLYGNVFDDTGTGFIDLDICDFDLGGNEHKDTIKTGIEQYSSENISVDFINITGNGLRFLIKNNKSTAVNVVCDSLSLDGIEQTPSYGTITIPGKSVGEYNINVISGNPDLLTENIKVFKGTMYTFRQGTTEDKFSISNEKNMEE